MSPLVVLVDHMIRMRTYVEQKNADLLVFVQMLEVDSRGRMRRCAISRSEEHTSELPSLMRISYPVFCLKLKPHMFTLLISNNLYFVTLQQLNTIIATIKN